MRHRTHRLGGTVALWTGDEANVAFYEKFGFTVASRHDGVGATAW